MDVSGSFFNVYLYNSLFEFLFVMLNQKLDFSFCESFIYNKKCYVPFLQVLSPAVVFFSMKAITENQLHNFLINSRDSYKKCCLHSCTLWGITITIDPLIKFWLRKGDCFVKKLSFSFVFLRWSWIFFTNRTDFIYWSTSPKNSRNLMLEVANLLKLTLFSVRSLKTLTPAFSQIFPVTPIFFLKILTTSTKECIIQKPEGVRDVRA